jgi:hypothetical protein
MMRPYLPVTLCLFSSLALASSDFDPAGPSVDWVGQIVSQKPYHEDTCFTLRQSRYAPDRNQPETFMACAFGYFNASEYQTGRWLEARGILQPQNQPQPVIGAAWVEPTSSPYTPYDDPMMMYGPFGPFGYPFAGPYPYGYPMSGMWMNPYFPY